MVLGPLIAVAFPVEEHGLWGTQASVVATHWLSSCGSRALMLCGMWDLSISAIEPVSPALEADSLPLSPQGSPAYCLLKYI